MERYGANSLALILGMLVSVTGVISPGFGRGADDVRDCGDSSRLEIANLDGKKKEKISKTRDAEYS